MFFEQLVLFEAVSKQDQTAVFYCVLGAVAALTTYMAELLGRLPAFASSVVHRVRGTSFGVLAVGT